MAPLQEETGVAKPPSVEAYLAALTDERRAAMEQLLQAIRDAAPEATESIAYQMPAFRTHGGQFLVSCAAFKAHYSLFPASDAVIVGLGDELTPYLVGSGTIRFPGDKPIPTSLVTRIVTIRLAENAAHAGR